MKNELRQLYEAIHELTHAACESCPDPLRQVPHRCCDALACANARRWASIKGVTLEDTGHPTLPFMGEKGCVVDIMLKPICTMFCCDTTDCANSERYRELKRRIIELEGEDWRKYLDR